MAADDTVVSFALHPRAQDVRVALKKYHAEYSEQNAKDKKTYGGMFASNEGLYSKTEQEEMKKAPPAQEDKATNNVSDAELKARAKAMGIDLVSESQSSISPALGVLKIFPLLLLHAS